MYNLEPLILPSSVNKQKSGISASQGGEVRVEGGWMILMWMG